MSSYILPLTQRTISMDKMSDDPGEGRDSRIDMILSDEGAGSGAGSGTAGGGGASSEEGPGMRQGKSRIMDDEAEGLVGAFGRDDEKKGFAWKKPPRRGPYAFDLKMGRASIAAFPRAMLLLRRPAILMCLLGGLLFTIILLSVSGGGVSEDQGGEFSRSGYRTGGAGGKSKEKLQGLTMESVYDAGVRNPPVSYRWVTGAVDGSFIERRQDSIILNHVIDAANATVLAKISEIVDDAGQSIHFTSFTPSADLKYLLLETDHQKGWRHSFWAKYYLYSIAEKAVIPLTITVPTVPDEAREAGFGKVSLALWSPVGHNVAWVRDNDVYVTVDAKTEVRITADGSKDVINGVADWVYEEEVLSTHDAMWFSPDGLRLAFLKFNETLVPDFHLQQYMVQEIYPKEVRVKYPKAGANNPVVTLYVADPTAIKSSHRNVAVDFPEEATYSDEDRLIVEVRWLTNDTLIVRMTNRMQDSQRIYLVQSEEQAWMGTLLREEENEDGAWFNNLQPITVIPPSSSVGRTHASYLELKEDARGHTHLAYFASVTSPKPLTWLTAGSFEVTSVEAVDATTGCVYYTSTEEGSTQRHLYAVHLDGSGRRRLTPPSAPPGPAGGDPAAASAANAANAAAAAAGKGIAPEPEVGKGWKVDWAGSVRTWNLTKAMVAGGAEATGGAAAKSGTGAGASGGLVAGAGDGVGGEVGVVGYYSVDFSPGCQFYLLSYMGPDVPFQALMSVEKPSTSKIVAKNEEVHQKLKNLAMPREAYLKVPVATTTPKGDTEPIPIEVNVRLLVPNDFDPSGARKYPLLVRVYGGPGSQIVRQVYEAGFETGVASAGVVVATIDPRGTGFKGRAFRSSVSKKLGVVETADIVEATRWLIALGFIDAGRCAIWGWSYGGFLTTKVIESNSGIFSVGMAVAPVTDWRFYDSIYTERYMKTPLLNPTGYEASAIKNMAGFRNADFLLMHGMMDDNVHLQNSAILIYRLTAAQIRKYRSQLFTDSDHNINAGGANMEVYALLWEFMAEHFGIKSPVTSTSRAAKIASTSTPSTEKAIKIVRRDEGVGRSTSEVAKFRNPATRGFVLEVELQGLQSGGLENGVLR
ncbi:hypothetical protein HK101_011837 [Irineochytrium annulatum]|nr:hypothetical protein HK101_011837 [Irineochytrium annulatum]